MTISLQIIWLFVLSIPIACVAWTVTHEEVFREPRDLCVKLSKNGKHLLQRKFYYLFTCEYCFSHYVTLVFIVITDYKLLMLDWRGYLIAWFALVWIANIYMSMMAYIRQSIKMEKTGIKILEQKTEKQIIHLKDKAHEVK